MHGTKIINWSTPKQIKALKTKYYRGKAKHSKNCKILKGEHVFDRIEEYRIMGKLWLRQKRCICGKKGSWQTPDMGDKWYG